MDIKALSALSPALIRTASVASSLIVSVYITSSMGLAQAGIYAVCFATLFGLTTFCKMGYDLAIVRELATEETTLKFNQIIDLVKKPICLIGLASITSWWLVNIIAQATYAQSSLTHTLFTTLLALPSFSICCVLAGIFRALNQQTAALMIEPVSFFILLIPVNALTLYLKIELTLNLLFSYLIIISYCMLFLYIFYLKRLLSKSKKNKGRERKRHRLDYNFQLHTSTLLEYIKNLGVILLAGLQLPNEALGAIHISQRIASVFSFLLSIFNSTTQTKLASLWKINDKIEWRKYYISQCRALALLSLFPVLILIFGGEYVLELLNIQKSIFPLLLIFSTGYLIVALCGPSNVALQMIYQEKKVVLINLFFVVLTSLIIISSSSVVTISIAMSSMLALSSLSFLALTFYHVKTTKLSYDK